MFDPMNHFRTRLPPPVGRWLAALALAGMLASGAAFAAVTDPVPLPRLRPALATDAPLPPPAKAEPRGGIQFPKLFQRKKDSRPSPFPPEQQALLANIDAYFNSFRTMEGQFTQIGPNGEQSEGVFFMTRPGRIRFHYNPPSKLDVVSDGSSVAIKDGRTRTQDLYPLNATPLRYLLADQIDLTSANIVRGIREESDLISLVISDGSAQGKLTLIFDRKTFALRQWVVTDAQGLNTSVAIYNTTTGKPQNPNLFRITPGNTY
jgi:outer membrane lipoprotein-sorting protein